METRKLAPIYLDNQPVGLQGDPKPQVSKIITASGKRPESVEVRRLMSQADTQGKTMKPDEVIDRTASSTTPIYLKSAPKQGKPTNPGGVTVSPVKPISPGQEIFEPSNAQPRQQPRAETLEDPTFNPAGEPQPEAPESVSTEDANVGGEDWRGPTAPQPKTSARPANPGYPAKPNRAPDKEAAATDKAEDEA